MRQIDSIGGFSFNTDYTVNRVRQHPEAYFVSVYDAQRGDVVIFDWDGGGTDHVGFVEKNLWLAAFSRPSRVIPHLVSTVRSQLGMASGVVTARTALPM